MKYNAIPENSVNELLRSLCMAIQVTSMYGSAHNVTAKSLQEAFSILEPILRTHGSVEIANAENSHLVNGVPISSTDSALHRFFDRMEMHNVGGVQFRPGITSNEFDSFMSMMALSTSSLAAQGGFKKALEGARLRGVSVVDIEYRRVTDQTADARNGLPAGARPLDGGGQAYNIGLGDGLGPIDITQAMLDAMPFSIVDDGETNRRSGEAEAMAKTRRENAIKIAGMLRETATLFEKSATQPTDIGEKQILASIERILNMVEASSRETRVQINRLAGKVKADRLTIASIEQAARKRRVGFNLTRTELLEQYAEINQEMLQPITAAIGAIEILFTELDSSVTNTQRELIKLAHESLERANQLIRYMNRISGLPDTLTPDPKVIKGTYTEE